MRSSCQGSVDLSYNLYIQSLLKHDKYLSTIGTSGSDDLLLYMLTKSGAMRTHNLSLPVTGSIRITATDNIMFCHCVESRLSVAYDIFASSLTNQSGIVLDSPICGASMLATGVSPEEKVIAEEPYTGAWDMLPPSSFWNPINKTLWVVICDLENVLNSMHDPRRLFSFLARRGQQMQSTCHQVGDEMSPYVGSYLSSIGPAAKCLMMKKLYSSVIEKVGLPWLQTAFDSTIAPYGNEVLRLKKLALDEPKAVSPTMRFKGAKVR